MFILLFPEKQVLTFPANCVKFCFAGEKREKYEFVIRWISPESDEGLLESTNYKWIHISLLILTFTTLWTYLADNKQAIFFPIFPQKSGLNISCKLSRRSLFFMEDKKNILKCHLLKILPSMLLFKELQKLIIYLRLICMKCQNLFSGGKIKRKKKKNIVCWKFLLSMLSIKRITEICIYPKYWNRQASANSVVPDQMTKNDVCYSSSSFRYINM